MGTALRAPVEPVDVWGATPASRGTTDTGGDPCSAVTCPAPKSPHYEPGYQPLRCFDRGDRIIQLLDPSGHGDGFASRLRRRPGLSRHHRELPPGGVPHQLEHHVAGLTPGLLHRQTHQQGPDLGRSGLDGPVEIVVRTGQNLERRPLQIVTEQGRFQLMSDILGPVDGQAQRFESGAELAGVATAR
jgi:hypothetical protein